MSEPPSRVPPESLKRLCCAALEKVGAPSAHAQVVADSLVEANLRGVDSHGVTRLGIYLQRIRAGLCDPTATGEIVAETPSTVLIDGRQGFGQVVGLRAMHMALDKAARCGTGLAAVRNSTHFGAAAYFSMEALKKDMVGLALTNAPATMAPWGGTQAYLGTNPISVAVPAGEEEPFVLDMATSVVARGYVILAAKKGEPIPLGWAIDRQGRPTQDAQEALLGTVLPVGGYKGYGLALLVEILCGVLSGASFGPHIGSLYEDFTRPQDCGHFFGAINVASFMPIAAFKARMDQICRELKQNPPAPGFERVYIAGEIEALKAEERTREGLPLDATTLGELRQIAQELGLSPQL